MTKELDRELEVRAQAHSIFTRLREVNKINRGESAINALGRIEIVGYNSLNFFQTKLTKR